MTRTRIRMRLRRGLGQGEERRGPIDDQQKTDKRSTEDQNDTKTDNISVQC